MIVSMTKDGWDVIYQRAHALLAAQLAGQWKRTGSPLRLYETIAAISHHDDQEREWVGSHLTENGAPLDFTLSKTTQEVSLAKLKKHLEEYLNQNKEITYPELQEFLETQLTDQARWQQELGITKEEADRSYQFMQWCDRLSLILTQKQVPEDGRALEITHGIDQQRYDLRCLEDGNLTVEPWPFEDDQFTVNVETCHLSQLKFDDDEALTKALKQAPIRSLEWKFAKTN
jgi:hypothetical protein